MRSGAEAPSQLTLVVQDALVHTDRGDRDIAYA